MATTTTQHSMPDWYMQYMRNNLGRAESVAGEDFHTYTGPRVADINNNQQSAFDITRQGVGGWTPMMQMGVGALTGSAAALNASDKYDKNTLTNEYLSPYTSGVVDEIGRRGMRQFNEQLMPQINNQFTGSGQFGSSRHAAQAGQAARDTATGIAGQQAVALESAYNDANKVYSDWANRGIQAAQTGANIGQQFANLGSMQQRMNLTDAEAMGAIGQYQRDFEQSNLDLAYKDFLEQRDYPKAQAAWLSSILQGHQIPTQNVSYTQGQSSNPLGSLLGGALMAYGKM